MKTIKSFNIHNFLYLTPPCALYCYNSRKSVKRGTFSAQTLQYGIKMAYLFVFNRLSTENMFVNILKFQKHENELRYEYLKSLGNKLGDPQTGMNTYLASLKKLLGGNKAPIIPPLNINNVFVTDVGENVLFLISSFQSSVP